MDNKIHLLSRNKVRDAEQLTTDSLSITQGQEAQQLKLSKIKTKVKSNDTRCFI